MTLTMASIFRKLFRPFSVFKTFFAQKKETISKKMLYTKIEIKILAPSKGIESSVIPRKIKTTTLHATSRKRIPFMEVSTVLFLLVGYDKNESKTLILLYTFYYFCQVMLRRIGHKSASLCSKQILDPVIDIDYVSQEGIRTRWLSMIK